MPCLLQLPLTGPSLFESEYPRYLALFHWARLLALQVRAHPHRLRHGGALADAILRVSGLTLMEHGPEAPVRGVARYREPSRYLRQLALHSADDMKRARAAPERIVLMVRAVTSEVVGTSCR